MTDGHTGRSRPAAAADLFFPASRIHVVTRSRHGRGHAVGQSQWAEMIPMTRGRSALSIGVVDAEGQPARQITDRLRAAGRACADQGLLTAASLSTLDGVLQETAANTRATAVFALHDSATRSLELSNAGPYPPAIVTPSGSTELVAKALSPPLGTQSGSYDSVSIPFPTGSSLVLYLHTVACPASGQRSDELVNRIGEARLFTRGRKSAGRICSALATALGCGYQDHETTVLIAQTWEEEGDMDHPGQWFPPRPASAATARAFTLRIMDEWNMGDKANRAAVIVGELATNAIQHSATPFEVRLHRTPKAIILEVTDHNDEPPAPTSAGPFDAGHRGLTIVEALADRWGTRPVGPGKVVWAELRLEPRPRDEVLDPPGEDQ